MQRDFAGLMESAGVANADAPPELFAALYRELHQLAERQLRGGRGGAAHLGATTLIHEAYLNVTAREGIAFPDRARFLGYAARAMRGIVVDHARRTHALKRGGDAWEITFAEVHEPAATVSFPERCELEPLSEALDELARLEPLLAELVDLHFFCGYSFKEIGELRGVSERTTQRDFRKARLLLQHVMSADVTGTSPLPPVAAPLRRA
jgi:RNA polymerase sigma factor (TIGR02999 family)